MMGIEVVVSGLPQAVRGLSETARWTYTKEGILDAALHIRAQQQKYPPQSSRPQPFKTEKQRRYVMAAIRRGEIVVPYMRGLDRRSQKLGQSWTLNTANMGFTATVGTAAGYGPLVQSAAKQTRYHKQTGWQTIEATLQRERNTIQQKIERGAERDINGT